MYHVGIYDIREWSCYGLSRIKAKVSPAKRDSLNTTIDAETLKDFREYSKKLGLPMGMLLEAFMKQLVNGEFYLKFGKNNKIEVDIEEDKKE